MSKLAHHRVYRFDPGAVFEGDLLAALEPGAAIFAVLQAGASATVLEDAVARCGGRRIADEPADNASTLAEVGQRLSKGVSSSSAKA